jgi:hypothetical protein
MNRIGNLTLSSKTILWKFISFVATLGLIAMLGVAPALAQATTVTDNVLVPTEIFVFVPCARGGAGEFVELTGTLHILFVTTIDDKGGFHSKFHFQPQGITGTGFTTGDKYQGTGVTQGSFNGKVGFETTFVNNFKIIGQGAGNNFLIHENFHVTVNANGEVTASVDNFSVKCKSASYP